MKCKECKLREEHRFCVVVDHQVNLDAECEAPKEQLQSYVKLAKETITALQGAIFEANHILQAGEWSTEKCPKCGATLLVNKAGNKWCSMVGCDWGCGR